MIRTASLSSLRLTESKLLEECSHFSFICITDTGEQIIVSNENEPQLLLECLDLCFPINKALPYEINDNLVTYSNDKILKVLQEGSSRILSPYKVKIHDISVYMQAQCNYNCHYCDRDYLDAKSIGRLKQSDVTDIVTYINKLEYNMISFHGGEPLLNVRVIDSIIDNTSDTSLIFIQTNGSLILKNKDFFQKHKNQLFVSISYDFLFQEENRGSFDIVGTINFLKENGIQVKLQSVLPMYDLRSTGFEFVQSVYDVFSKAPFDGLTLIPLQFIRNDKGYNYIYTKGVIPMKVYLARFQKLLEYLYVMNIYSTVMGYEDDYNRHYFDYTKQLVIAPDGYVYPDYAFVENMSEYSRLGAWRNNMISIKTLPTSEIASDPYCLTCSRNDKCGRQYVSTMNKHLYNIEYPSHNDRGDCKLFSTGMEYLMNYNTTLQRKPTLGDHINGV